MKTNYITSEKYIYILLFVKKLHTLLTVLVNHIRKDFFFYHTKVAFLAYLLKYVKYLCNHFGQNMMLCGRMDLKHFLFYNSLNSNKLWVSDVHYFNILLIKVCSTVKLIKSLYTPKADCFPSHLGIVYF